MEIFKIKKPFVLNEDNEQEILNKMSSLFSQQLNVPNVIFERLKTGQNFNYKVLTQGDLTPKYLLRIIRICDYPSKKTLQNCYSYLEKSKILYPKIVCFDDTPSIVPYGFFIQEWIEGHDASIEENREWIKDFTKLLNEVHKIKIPYFGYLNDGPKYPTVYDYFLHMDEVIDHSFGNIKKCKFSIWDLEAHNITSPNFLKETFSKINELAHQIKSPIESVLLHGDMLPQNLIYSGKDKALIDWDESRANCFVYDISRCLFYMDDKTLLDDFLKYYEHNNLTREEIEILIRLEHVRQWLRIMMISCFSGVNDETKLKIRNIEKEIQDLTMIINKS